MPLEALGYFYAFSGTVFFSLASIYFREFTQKTSPLWLNAFKAFVALPLFGLFALFFRPEGVFSPPVLPVFIFAFSGLIGLGIGDLFLLRSFVSIGPARTFMIFRFQPLLFALAHFYYDGSVLNLWHWIAIILMTLCVLTITLEGYQKRGDWNLFGIGLALLGLLFDSIGLGMSRWAFDHAPQITVMEGNFYRTFGAALFFLTLLLFIPYRPIKRFLLFQRKEKLGVFLTAVFGTFLSLWFWLKAVSLSNLSVVTAIGGISPLIAALFEALILKMRPNRYLWWSLFFSLTGFAALIFAETP